MDDMLILKKMQGKYGKHRKCTTCAFKKEILLIEPSGTLSYT